MIQSNKKILQEKRIQFHQFIYKKIPKFTFLQYLDIYSILLERHIYNIQNKIVDRDDPKEKLATKTKTIQDYWSKIVCSIDKNYHPEDKNTDDEPFYYINNSDKILMEYPLIIIKYIKFWIKTKSAPKIFSCLRHHKGQELDYIVKMHEKYCKFDAENKIKGIIDTEPNYDLDDEDEEIVKPVNIFVGQFDIGKFIQNELDIRLNQSGGTNTFIFTSKKKNIGKSYGRIDGFGGSKSKTSMDFNADTKIYGKGGDTYISSFGGMKFLDYDRTIGDGTDKLLNQNKIRKVKTDINSGVYTMKNSPGKNIPASQQISDNKIISKGKSDGKIIFNQNKLEINSYTNRDNIEVSNFDIGSKIPMPQINNTKRTIKGKHRKKNSHSNYETTGEYKNTNAGSIFDGISLFSPIKTCASIYDEYAKDDDFDNRTYIYKNNNNRNRFNTSSNGFTTKRHKGLYTETYSTNKDTLRGSSLRQIPKPRNKNTSNKVSLLPNIKLPNYLSKEDLYY